MTDNTGGTIDLDLMRVAQEEDHLAVQITQLWTQWMHSPLRQRQQFEADEVKRFLKATNTDSTTNRNNGHAHSTHRPKLSQIADTLAAHYVAALFPKEDWNQFVPDSIDSDDQIIKRKIEGYLRNRHRLYRHEAVMGRAVLDYIQNGTSFCAVEWVSESVADNDGMLEKAYVGPKVVRLNPRRVGFDTEARSFHDSWKIIQAVKSFGEIALQIEDETLPEAYRQILSRSMEFRSTVRSAGFDSFEAGWLDASYSGYGTNQSYWFDNDTVEILTFYGSIYDIKTQTLERNRKIVVVDRKWVLMNEGIDTWDGKPYIYKVSWRDDPDNLMGTGPLHNLTGMQYMVNHLQNAKADAFDLMITPDKILIGVDDVKTLPDGSKEYYAHENGVVKLISPDTNILNADLQIETLERKMEEYVGVPRQAAGIKVPGEQTKFEVQTLDNASSLLFQSKVEKFERELLEQTLNAELELSRRKLSEDLLVMVASEEGDAFEVIDRKTLKQSGNLVAKGARHHTQQARLVQELSGFMQALAADEEVKTHFPPKRIAQAWNSLLGGFGSEEGLFEEYGRIAEGVELAQFQQAAGREIDNSSIATQSLDDPSLQTEGGPGPQQPTQ